MRILNTIWQFLKEASGETAYERYCVHLRSRHPDRRVPGKAEFYLLSLEEKYSRPSRCC